MEVIAEIIYMITDGAYVKSLDEYSDIGTHWIDFHLHNDSVNSVAYFDSFGVEHIPKW